MRSSAMPGRDRRLDPLGEERLDVRDDVVVAGLGLHRPRRAEHVHQADVDAALGHERRHVGVAAQRGDVVDVVGAGVERGRRDRGLGRVDRDPHARVRRADPLDHGDHARELLALATGLGARARRLAADVEQVGALEREPQPVARPRRRDRGTRRRRRTSPA